MFHSTILFTLSLISILTITGKVSANTANTTNNAQHESHDHSQHNAPLGVMGNHLMEKNSWMFSYRFMNMTMDGNRSGTSAITNQQIFNQGFMVAPLSMNMDMHMFGFMYGYNDDVTLMLMAPYLKNEMSLITMGGMRFTTRSEGLGDIKLVGLFNVFNERAQKLHLNIGLSLPTGSIDERDNTPAMANAKLPYPMQLGSGTLDLILGATYTEHLSQSWTWGLQGLATVRTGTNKTQYKLADKVEVSAWVAKPLFNSTNGSLRLKYQRWGNIEGADAALNSNMVPTADPNLRAGRRVDLIFGLQYGADKSADLFSIELGLPIYQKLDGPQLETDRTLQLAWQHNF